MKILLQLSFLFFISHSLVGQSIDQGFTTSYGCRMLGQSAHTVSVGYHWNGWEVGYSSSHYMQRFENTNVRSKREGYLKLRLIPLWKNADFTTLMTYHQTREGGRVANEEFTCSALISQRFGKGRRGLEMFGGISECRGNYGASFGIVKLF